MAQIGEKIKARKKLLETHRFPIQPLLVLLGPAAAIRQVFIVLDETRWEVASVAEGLLGVFKMIFGLNSSYPVEARHIFLFLQRTLFGLKCKDDFANDKGLNSFLSARFNEHKLFLAK